MMPIVNLQPTHVQTWTYGGIYRVKRYTKLGTFILNMLVRLGWIAKDGLSVEHVKYVELRMTNEIINYIYEQMMTYEHYTGRRAQKIIVGRDQQLKIFRMNEAVSALSIPLDRIGHPQYRLFGKVLELNPLIDGVVVTD